MKAKIKNSLQLNDFIKEVESRDMKEFDYEFSITFKTKGEKGWVFFKKLIKMLDFMFIFVLEATRKYPKRTLSQNRLLWLWMTALETDSETGYTKDEFYQMFVKKYAPRKEMFGEEITITTSMMDTLQKTKFLDKIQTDVLTSEFYQMVLPNPSDRNFERFYEYYKDKM